MIKQTLDENPSGSDPPERITLYAYPGDFERRGVRLDVPTSTYVSDPVLGTENQYLIAGARVVWRDTGTIDGLDRDRRITFALTDLLGSTSAVVDLDSGELLEASTFYPNGAVETQQTTDQLSLQLEPMGFTGKEGDDEVGLVYFGERYLMPHLGRWASPDPLHVHASGGGEALNSYHYVAGSLLEARDPLGLNSVWLGGAGYEDETRRYSQPIVEKMRDEGVPEPEYVPISQPGPGGQLSNILVTLSARGVDMVTEKGREREERLSFVMPRVPVSLLDRAVNDAASASSEEGGTRNLVGYSYGTVVAAQAALQLASEGKIVDNLVLVGSPITEESPLYRELIDNKNILHVTRIDIEGDPFSGGVDPSKIGDMERHFLFIDNEKGQQDWLAKAVAHIIRRNRQCEDPPCERSHARVQVDPEKAQLDLTEGDSRSADEPIPEEPTTDTE